MKDIEQRVNALNWEKSSWRTNEKERTNMNMVTKDTVDKLINAYEGRINELENELSTLRAEKAAEQPKEEPDNKGKTNYDLIRELKRELEASK